MAAAKESGSQGTITLTKPRLLIVEGKDESEFFESYIRRMQSYVSEITNIQIFNGGGKAALPGLLKAIRNTQGFNDTTNRVQSVGIIRDADANPVSAFQSVYNALREAKLPVPDQPLRPVGNELQVVVMIMPGANQPGALEDLCLKAVQNDEAMKCIDDYFLCLEHSLPENKRPKHSSKAKVQAFLASRKEAVRDLGTAAQKRYWGDWDHEAFAEVRKFLEILCS